MRITFVTTGLKTGGAERMLVKLLAALPAGVDAEVISLTDRGPVADDIEGLGVPVRFLGMRPGFPVVSAFFRLVRHLKQRRPNIVQTWMYHADLIGGLAARLAGVKAVIWNIRNSDLSPEKTKWTTRATVRIAAWLSSLIPVRIVSCSHAARDVHINLGYDSRRFVVIPNGFDLSLYAPNPLARLSVRRELGIALDASIIGLIARFDPQKDHRVFFEAAGLLHRKRPDVHFLLAGKGVENTSPDIRQWVDEAGVIDVTRLLGERRDIPRLTATLDIATSSSSWGEAFPNVLGEAMACGVPCVATDVGDSAFIIGDAGRIVPRGDAAALARAWEDLLEMSDEQRCHMGESARGRIAGLFDINIIAERYVALYASLATY